MEVRKKEEKRKIRLKKALRKLGKKERLPKPLSSDSIEPPLHLLKQRDIRSRQDLTPITEEIEEERIEIVKEWSRFSKNRHRHEIQQIDRMLYSQKAALEKLRELDQNLYKMAIQIDNNLVPFNAKGPLSTPPIPEYIQDGEYEDVTRKYEVKYDNMETFLREVIKNTRAKRSKKKTDEDEE